LPSIFPGLPPGAPNSASWRAIDRSISLLPGMPWLNIENAFPKV